MGELMPASDGLATRDSRRASRAVSRSRASSQTRMARVADEADVAIEKVEQVSYTTVTGMMAVARVGGVLTQLESQNPALSGRLNRLADYHELAVAQTIEDLRRDLRRR